MNAENNQTPIIETALYSSILITPNTIRITTIALDKYDKNIVINALNTLRTRQLQEERPTEPVDELISKVAHAPTKKVKVVHCRCNEERWPENEPTLPNQARPIPTPIILFLNGCAMRYNFVFLFSMSQNAKVNTIVHKNGINSAQNLQIAGLLFSGIGSNPASNAQPMKKNNCFS